MEFDGLEHNLHTIEGAQPFPQDVLDRSPHDSVIIVMKRPVSFRDE